MDNNSQNPNNPSNPFAVSPGPMPSSSSTPPPTDTPYANFGAAPSAPSTPPPFGAPTPAMQPPTDNSMFAPPSVPTPAAPVQSGSAIEPSTPFAPTTNPVSATPQPSMEIPDLNNTPAAPPSPFNMPTPPAPSSLDTNTSSPFGQSNPNAFGASVSPAGGGLSTGTFPAPAPTMPAPTAPTSFGVPTPMQPDTATLPSMNQPSFGTPAPSTSSSPFDSPNAPTLPPHMAETPMNAPAPLSGPLDNSMSNLPQPDQNNFNFGSNGNPTSLFGSPTPMGPTDNSQPTNSFFGQPTAPSSSPTPDVPSMSGFGGMSQLGNPTPTAMPSSGPEIPTQSTDPNNLGNLPTTNTDQNSSLGFGLSPDSSQNAANPLSSLAPTTNTESTPTDLSHLIQQTTENPATASAPNGTPTSPLSPAPGMSPQTPAMPVSEHPSGQIPKWVIGLGIALLLSVMAASGYFILGIGAKAPDEVSVPANETTNLQAPPTAPSPSPVVQASPESSPSPEAAQATPAASSSSAADLLRSRQGN